jgi:hypothetical protein
VVQLSTYDNRGGNSQEEVEEKVSQALLNLDGWHGPIVVRLDKAMMCLLIFTTDMGLDRLPERFEKWVAAI